MDKASKAVRSSRTYKERAQPQERKRLGLLEKHKDYALRARSFNAKQKTLASLRQKALDRNPDEFYFGMINSSGPSPLHKRGTGMLSGKKKNANVHSVDAMRLLKTQDAGYVRTVRNVALKEMQRLEESARAAEGWSAVGADMVGKEGRERGKTRKVIFVDGEADLVGKGERSIVVADESEHDAEKEDEDVELARRRSLKAKKRERLQSKLKNAQARLKALAEAEEALDMQRAKMGKSPTVGGVNKHGVKFKIRERKR